MIQFTFSFKLCRRLQVFSAALPVLECTCACACLLARAGTRVCVLRLEAAGMQAVVLLG